MDLSIIIPVYNTDPGMLKKCLDSIYETTSVDYECLVVNDGSDGKKTKIYEELTRKYPSCKYFYKVNGGVSSARNYGIQNSRGKYIAFVDSDDLVDFSSIKKFINVDKEIVFSNLEVIKDKNKSIWKAFDKNSGEVSMSEALERLSTTGTLNGPYCKLIKKSLIQNHKITFNPALITGEDAVFFMNLLMSDPSMYFFDETSYFYFNDDNTSTSRTLNHPDTVIENYNIINYELVKLINKFFTESDQEYCILVKNAYQRYLKQVFNTAAELVLANRLDNDRLQLIINSRSFINLEDIKGLSKISKLRYLILKYRLKGILWLIGKIRFFYLKIK